jgi:hypothetical protein
MPNQSGNAVWETIVRRLCSAPTVLPPDVKRLAVRCGLRVVPDERDGETLCGLRAYYDATASPDEQDEQVARCVARHALERLNERQSDDAIDYIALAVLRWAHVAPSSRRSSGTFPIRMFAQA